MNIEEIIKNETDGMAIDSGLGNHEYNMARIKESMLDLTKTVLIKFLNENTTKVTESDKWGNDYNLIVLDGDVVENTTKEHFIYELVIKSIST